MNLYNNNKKCKNETEIINLRDSSFLVLFLVDTNVDFNNYINPKTTYVANFYWKLSSTKYFKSESSSSTPVMILN